MRKSTPGSRVVGYFEEAFGNKSNFPACIDLDIVRKLRKGLSLRECGNPSWGDIEMIGELYFPRKFDLERLIPSLSDGITA
jgi:hypothetical protein